MKKLICILLLFAAGYSQAQTTIGEGNLKAVVIGTEKIPVSGTGHPVISGNRLHAYHKARFDSLYAIKYAGAIGPIYSAASFTDLSAFTSFGGTATVVSNKINFSGGSNDWSKGIYLTNHKTQLDKWTMQADIKLTNLTAGRMVGIGIYSLSNPTKAHISFHIYANGLVYVANGSAGNMDVDEKFLGSMTAAPALNHTYRFIAKKVSSKLIFQIQDLGTTDLPTIFTYDFAFSAGNMGAPCIWNLGNTFTVNNLYYSGDDLLNPNVLLIGDSRTARLNTPSGTSWNDLLAKDFQGVETYSGGGDCTGDVVALLSGELTTIKAKIALVSLGVNDIATGVSTATTEANYDAIYNALTANGSIVYFLLGFYSVAFDQSILNAYIVSHYPNNYIDTSMPVGDAGDGLHQSVAGQYKIYQLITQSNKLKDYAASPATMFSYPNSVMITDSKGVETTGNLGFANGGASGDNSLTMGSPTGGVANIAGSTSAGNYTRFTNISNGAAQISLFMGYSNAFNTSAAPEWGAFNWNSGWIFGMNQFGYLSIAQATTKPTAKVHIGAGSATAGTAPIKVTTGGTQLTTPEPLVLEPATGDANLLWTNGASQRLTVFTGYMGQTTLVTGTKAISTVTGVGTGSFCVVTLVTPTGTTLTTAYQCVCTSNTITIQANVAAGTINTADGSVVNYFVKP